MNKTKTMEKWGHKLQTVTFDFDLYIVRYEYNDDRSLTISVVGKSGRSYGMWVEKGRRLVNAKKAFGMLTWAIYKNGNDTRTNQSGSSL